MISLKLFKKHKLLFFVFFVYIVLFILTPKKGIESVNNTMYYIIEMLEVLPPIFLLTSIIETWVPKEVIINSFGEKSGVKGTVLSFLLGSLSAGPIYAAFPVCKMLFKKGASISNIVIILSTWAVIKVPMLANEAKFLGIKFMIIRWVITLISIFLMAYIVSLIVRKEDMLIDEKAIDSLDNDININRQYCIGCGLCAKLHPEIFIMIDKKAEVNDIDIDEALIDNISDIEKNCPAKAIMVSKKSRL